MLATPPLFPSLSRFIRRNAYRSIDAATFAIPSISSRKISTTIETQRSIASPISESLRLSLVDEGKIYQDTLDVLSPRISRHFEYLERIYTRARVVSTKIHVSTNHFLRSRTALTFTRRYLFVYCTGKMLKRDKNITIIANSICNVYRYKYK